MLLNHRWHSLLIPNVLTYSRYFFRHRIIQGVRSTELHPPVWCFSPDLDQEVPHVQEARVVFFLLSCMAAPANFKRKSPPRASCQRSVWEVCKLALAPGLLPESIRSELGFGNCTMPPYS